MLALHYNDSYLFYLSITPSSNTHFLSSLRLPFSLAVVMHTLFFHPSFLLLLRILLLPNTPISLFPLLFFFFRTTTHHLLLLFSSSSQILVEEGAIPPSPPSRGHICQGKVSSNFVRGAAALVGQIRCACTYQSHCGCSLS